MKITDKNYHGLLNELDRDPQDTRVEEYARQLEERGFDDTETWNLDVTIAKFTLPRLIRFKEITFSFPHELSSHGEWESILSKMIEAFKIIVSDEYYADRENPIVKEGLDLFRKYYSNLWS